jgi:hypothetical protein
MECGGVVKNIVIETRVVNDGSLGAVCHAAPQRIHCIQRGDSVLPRGIIDKKLDEAVCGRHRVYSTERTVASDICVAIVKIRRAFNSKPTLELQHELLTRNIHLVPVGVVDRRRLLM